ASCNLALKEYPQLFKNSEYEKKAKELSEKVYDVSEFLTQHIKLALPKDSVHRKIGERLVTYHDPCHLRVSGIVKPPRELLKRIPHLKFLEMVDADRCCGGAGTYILKNPDYSTRIFRRKNEAIEHAGADIVATSCPACMMQLNSGLKGSKKVKHIVQLLDEAYN
ncbi:MAG: (Fe-S)-binding protein, partial [Candidatus Bathyarchaeota archaeon]